MTDSTTRIESLPALRLAQVSGEVEDTSEIGAAVAVLHEALAAALGGEARGVVRTYCGRPDGSKIDVVVGVPLADGAAPAAGLRVGEVAAVERAAIVTHRGPAGEIDDVWHTLDIRLAELGLESFGTYRQVHLDEAGGHVVVELQCPVRDAGSCP